MMTSNTSLFVAGIVDSLGNAYTFDPILDQQMLVCAAGKIGGVSGAGSGSVMTWSGSAWVDSQRAADSRETVASQLRVANNAPCAVGYDQFCAMSLVGYSYDAGGDVAHEWTLSVRPSASGPQSDFYVSGKVGAGGVTDYFRLGSSGNHYLTGNLSTTGSTYGFLGAFVRVNNDRGGVASQLTLTNAEVAAGAGSATLNNVPTGYATTASYLKLYVGTTAWVMPGFKAT